MDTGFEVAVAGQNTGCDEFPFFNRGFYRSIEGAAVAYACGAAIAYEMKAELIQRFLKSGGL